MDSPSLVDSPLISPSKARQAASQAKDWAYIMNWLSRKYSPNPVPQFERNDDTLRTLFSIAAANDTADEEAALIHRAREETIRCLEAREGSIVGYPNDLLKNVEESLDGKGASSLDDLAESSVMLGSPKPDMLNLGQRITDLTVEEFNAAEQVRKIGTLQLYLEKELTTLQRQLGDVKHSKVYETPENLPAQTTEWLRGTKILSAKVSEYQDRIAALERSGGTKGPRIEELMAEEESVLTLREKVKSLENRVKMFHDLPPNVEDAKLEYERAKRELGALLRKRDTMFENLVER